ncbi:MAG: DNA primase, partial [Clostridia bacterium]|nr:DNA primase [Clostridia bacterium]
MANQEVWQNFIRELRDKSDLVSIASRYVQLERKGRQFWGRCPFHGEKTPSFTISPEYQSYHCFGCGVGGDVIKFIREIESVDFMGAVNILAELAHMEVPSSLSSEEESRIKERKQEKDRLIKLMKDAAYHYVENLKLPQAQPGRDYLVKRKISPEVARMFGMGYSINFNDMITYLTSKGYTLKEMETAGVIKYRDQKPYDAMGTRLVFPVIDVNNNVIAFCGRTLEANPTFAKYINTAETPLFSKTKSLFGINLVKKNRLGAERKDYIIVVEGHIDVVSLHKAGFNSAVASMGTALTNEQANLIKKFVDKVYICYDGDSAGKKATLRGLDILKSNGLEVFVMSLPEGMDPDDVINKYGQAGYQKLMDKALPLTDFKLEFLKNSFDLTNPDGKAKFVKEAIEVLKSLSDIEREVYLQKVSVMSGIMKDFLKRQLENSGEAIDGSKMFATAVIKQQAPERAVRKPDSNVIQAEKYILSALVNQKPYAFFKTDISKYFSENRQQYYKDIMDILAQTQENVAKKFYEKYEFDNASDEEQAKEYDAKLEEVSEIINYLNKEEENENETA